MKQISGNNLYTTDPNIKAYGPIPVHSELFQNNLGYEKPEKIHGWGWSYTFGKWSALITFKNGWHGFTYPKTW